MKQERRGGGGAWSKNLAEPVCLAYGRVTMKWWRYAGVGAIALALSGCKGHPTPVSPSGSAGEAGEAPSAQLAVASPEGGSPEAPIVKIAALESPTPITSA